MATLDMRFIRYLNLFERITRVRTKNCFIYNNTIMFAVPPSMISKAIGEQGRNIKQLSEILGKRIKVLALPSENRIREFISDIVSPLRFKSLIIETSSITINAGRENKASLLGRNKLRLEELNNITKEYFNKTLRIV